MTVICTQQAYKWDSEESLLTHLIDVFKHIYK